MPKYLPEPLMGTLQRIDEIIGLQTQALVESAGSKATVADLIRLFQFRLDLADRYDAMNPRPAVALWVDPAWAFDEDELPSALEALDQARRDYEAALQEHKAAEPVPAPAPAATPVEETS